jgi:benzoate membrane transport protein
LRARSPQSSGFASSFTIVLAGFAAAGASPAQAASGLLALCVVKGLPGDRFERLEAHADQHRLVDSRGCAPRFHGRAAGGYAVAVGAFSGRIGPCGRRGPVAAVWACRGGDPDRACERHAGGVLLELCLAPVRAVGAMPALALPIVLVWAVAWRFARLYAVPIAVAVTAAIVIFATQIPPGALTDISPKPVLVPPVFSLDALVGIALPLFIVTWPRRTCPVSPCSTPTATGRRIADFVSTGIASGIIGFFGGHLVNLAAITAALCAGPEAHPDPQKRWIAAAAAGAGYVVLGLFAGFFAAFIAASPPLLIQAVAGLALLGSLAGALAGALARDEERIPAILTFVTTASGISFFGIGAAFWGLLAGGAVLALARYRAASPAA